MVRFTCALLLCASCALGFSPSGTRSCGASVQVAHRQRTAATPFTAQRSTHVLAMMAEDLPAVDHATPPTDISTTDPMLQSSMEDVASTPTSMEHVASTPTPLPKRKDFGEWAGRNLNPTKISKIMTNPTTWKNGIYGGSLLIAVLLPVGMLVAASK